MDNTAKGDGDHTNNPPSTTPRGIKLRETGSLLAGGTAAVAAALLAFSAIRAHSEEQLFSATEVAGARTPAQATAVPGFTDLVDAVKPAVVSVKVKSRVASGPKAELQNPNPFEGTPFERFFRNLPQQNGQNRAPSQSQVVQAQGSGFFVSADGYIVTNNHVVDRAEKVEVTTDSGITYAARIIGTDPRTDLALIKVDGHSDFAFVRLAGAKPRIGEWVVAMGNPFGLGGTVTAGIVSAEGRDIGSGPYDDFIQIDAPVNRGNSGGPTFNLKGEVVGVNTAIYSPSGGSVGIAFDIPASTVANVIPILQSQGHITRGWLGVQIQAVTPELANSLGMTTPHGVLVSEPQAGGPADKAGLKAGDVITKLDGADVKDPRDLARRVAALGPDAKVDLGIVRDGHDQTIKMTLGRLQDRVGRTNNNTNAQQGVIERLGLTVAPASEVEGAGSAGVAIIDVDQNGSAAEFGLKAGDVILSVAGTRVSTPSDLVAALGNVKALGRKNALVLYRRGKLDQFVALPVATE